MSHVFISYSHANKDYVERLVNDLKSQQITYWYDESIRTGQDWRDELVNAIIRSSAVILVMSAAARQSDWVSREIQVATDQKIPILPLLLDGDVFPTLAHIQFFRLSVVLCQRKSFTPPCEKSFTRIPHFS